MKRIVIEDNVLSLSGMHLALILTFALCFFSGYAVHYFSSIKIPEKAVEAPRLDPRRDCLWLDEKVP